MDFADSTFVSQNCWYKKGRVNDPSRSLPFVVGPDRPVCQAVWQLHPTAKRLSVNLIESIAAMSKTPSSKSSSSRASTIAGKVLAGAKPTRSEIKTLAGSVLSQDPVKGQGRK